MDDIPNLEYTEKIVRESMRLYPPAWTLGRQAINDYNLDGYVIPAKSIILMSQVQSCIVIPNIFLSQTFFIPSGGLERLEVSSPGSDYFPFGGGIRGCIGEAFAWMEGILIVATVCRLVENVT